jgi:uncharacterized protein YqgC (DUF456 family)
MSEPPVILSTAEARKRFARYFGVKLAGLAALIGGVLAWRGGLPVLGTILVLVGAASVIVRPRWLGLASRRDR